MAFGQVFFFLILKAEKHSWTKNIHIFQFLYQIHRLEKPFRLMNSLLNLTLLIISLLKVFTALNWLRGQRCLRKFHRCF